MVARVGQAAWLFLIKAPTEVGASMVYRILYRRVSRRGAGR